MEILPRKPTIFNHQPPTHGGPGSVDTPHNTFLIDFSSSINPLGPPVSIVDALHRCITSISEYPDPTSTVLLDALSKYTKLFPTHLLVGNGAAELIYNFAFAFITNNTPDLIPIPTFQEYEAASSLNGAHIEYFETMNLANNLDKFLECVPENGCVFLCNPNNPSGVLLSQSVIRTITQTAFSKSTMVLLDECFIEMTLNPNQSIISDVKTISNLVVLRSLTKSFGMPGLRIGYVAAHPLITTILRRVQTPWSVNCMAQEAATTVLHCHHEHLQKTRHLLKQETSYIKSCLDSIDGFDYIDTSTNFVFVIYKKHFGDLPNRLLDHGILVRDCSNFRGIPTNQDHPYSYIRIAVRNHTDNMKLIHAIRQETMDILSTS